MTAPSNKKRPAKTEHAATAPALQSTGGDSITRDPMVVATDAFLDRVAETEFGNCSAAVRVAVRLARYVNHAELQATGRLIAWPSIRRMAADIKMWPHRVSRAVEALEDLGLVTVDRSGRNHRYELHLTPPIALRDVRNEKAPIDLGSQSNRKPKNALSSQSNDARMLSGLRTEVRDAACVGTGTSGACADTQVGFSSDQHGATLIHGGRAPEGAPACDTTEHPLGHASDPFLAGQPVTLADLDRLAAEELAAAQAMDDLAEDAPEPDPVAEAAADLRAVHGAVLDDAADFALDLLDGFPTGDPEAADRAARRSAALLIAARGGAADIWAHHCRVLHRLVLDASASRTRADAAVSDFHAAVAAAGEAIKADRRRALTETAVLGVAADV